MLLMVDDLPGCFTYVQSDMATVMDYIHHDGGMRSMGLIRHTRKLFLWCLDPLFSFTEVHTQGPDNLITDQLSRTR
jgi:hypothetical protein